MCNAVSKHERHQTGVVAGLANDSVFVNQRLPAICNIRWFEKTSEDTAQICRATCGLRWRDAEPIHTTGRVATHLNSMRTCAQMQGQSPAVSILATALAQISWLMLSACDHLSTMLVSTRYFTGPSEAHTCSLSW